jgi:uncharacterized protein (DUF362 family)
MPRRDFLKWAGLGAAGLLVGCRAADQRALQQPKPAVSAKVRGLIAVASTGTAAQMVQASLKPLGGIEAFVNKGDFVVVKPNIGWQRTPEQAANTNPKVVSAVIELCLKAGAKRVLVVEHTCDQPSQICFDMSGIEQAVKAAGGEIIAANRENQYEDIELPRAKILKRAKVAREIRAADCFINVPIAKDHSQARLTIGLKNLMGTVWDRGAWHSSPSLHQCIADYATVVRPHLTIVDATRILVGAGPKGPGPTKDTHQVIAAVDPVAADSYAATLFGLEPKDVEHLLRAQELGLGESDLQKAKIVKV